MHCWERRGWEPTRGQLKLLLCCLRQPRALTRTLPSFTCSEAAGRPLTYVVPGCHCPPGLRARQQRRGTRASVSGRARGQWYRMCSGYETAEQPRISPKLQALHCTGRSHVVSGSVTPATPSTSSPDPGEAKAEMPCAKVRRQVTGLWTQALDATRTRRRRAGSHCTSVKRDGHSRAFLSHVHSHREYQVKQRHVRVLGKDSKHRGPLSECLAGKTRKSVRTVSFIWIWLIFIRNNLCLNSPLNVNVSPSSTSFPLGLLTRTRALPHARDCSVLRSSLSSEWGENQAAATIKVSETRQE